MTTPGPFSDARFGSDQQGTDGQTGLPIYPAELATLEDLLSTELLTTTGALQVESLEAEFAARLGVRHVIACSSGTAALHAAVAALDLDPGSEVVTTPITDMGAITPMIYQGAIPVFADVDPRTGNITAATIEARLTERTRAVIVTHLFGSPCEMAAISDLLAERDIPMIEDCAQAYGAASDDRLVGSIGDLGCFSLLHGDHLTAGEAGLVATDDAALARRVSMFVGRGWPYGDQVPAHDMLTLQYRLTELQGALARARLATLDGVMAQRHRTVARLTDAIAGLPGVRTPVVERGDVHSFWGYCLQIDDRVVPGGSRALADRLPSYGVAAAARPLDRPAFESRVLVEQRTFGRSRWPFTLAAPSAIDYASDRYPGVYDALEHTLVLTWVDPMTDGQADALAVAVRTAVRDLITAPSPSARG